MNIHPLPDLALRQRCERRNGGFTLIELMVAMVLGLIVIAGVTSVFLAGQQSFRTNNALADVQDSSRIAFELMARDIRNASSTGCSNQGHIVNVLNNETTAWWANWANAVQGFDGTITNPGSPQVDPAVTTGTTAGQRLASTDSLQLIGAADTTYSVKDPGESSALTFTLNEPGANLQTGDIVMLCDPGQAAILQIGAFTSATSKFAYDDSTTAPGNNSTVLDYTGPGVLPPGAPFGANSLVALYNAADWYVGTNPDGGTSLYRMNLQNTGGVPAEVPQEMVRNVTGMQISYLAPGDTVHPNAFENAATIGADGAWALVTAIRVTLTLESTFQRASVNGNAPVVRTYAFTTTLRNRVN